MLTSLGERERWARAHFVTVAAIEYHGGAAMTRALRLGRGGRAWALLDAPGPAWLRDVGYALAVRSRGLLGWLARRLDAGAGYPAPAGAACWSASASSISFTSAMAVASSGAIAIAR